MAAMINSTERGLATEKIISKAKDISYTETARLPSKAQEREDDGGGVRRNGQFLRRERAGEIFDVGS